MAASSFFSISFLRKHRNLWRQKFFWRSSAYGVFLLIAGLACTMGARDYLSDEYVHILSAPDLILDLIPTMGMDNFIVWGVPLVIGIALFIHLLYPERIPFTLKSIGILFIIRSLFVILTPLGARPDTYILFPSSFLQRVSYSNDFFFSGHVSFPFLIALIFWEVRWVRFTMLSFSGLFAVGVLLAHTHYSIDVFAVPFIVPTIFVFCRFLFQQDLNAFPLKPAPDEILQARG